MEPQPLSENHRKQIVALQRKKGRTQQGRALIEGWRAVEAAIDGGAPLVEILVTQPFMDHKAFLHIIEETGLPIYRMSERDARRVASVENAQGIVAIVDIREPAVETLFSQQRVLVLDGVQDPGNVGTLIRTAAWFGIGGILCGPNTADLYNPKVVRASMGGLWDVHVVRTSDARSMLQVFKDRNFHLYGADLEGTGVAEWKPASPGVLVVGSEAHGISAEVAALLDETVVIGGAESRRATESLNAAVAAGIIMNQWASSG